MRTLVTITTLRYLPTVETITGIVEGTGAYSPACTFEVISGPGVLSDITVINAVLSPTASGSIVVRVRSAQDPTKFDDVTVSALPPGGLRIFLSASNLVGVGGGSPELWVDQDITDLQSNNATVTWLDANPYPKPANLGTHLLGESQGFPGMNAILCTPTITPVGPLNFTATMVCGINSSTAAFSGAGMFIMTLGAGAGAMTIYVELVSQTTITQNLRVSVAVDAFSSGVDDTNTYSTGVIKTFGIRVEAAGANTNVIGTVNGVDHFTIIAPDTLQEIVEVQLLRGVTNAYSAIFDFYQFNLQTL